MITIHKQIPFMLSDVSGHEELKEKVVRDIYSMGEYSFTNNDQKIFSTDWHLGSGFNRPYAIHVAELFSKTCSDIKQMLGSCIDVTVNNYWYQRYKTGDYHGWHEHFNCSYSNIYYTSLPDGAAKTTFRLGGEEFQIDVKEGQVLSFPAFIPHCSKPNESDQEKIVVVFNCN